MKKLAIYVGAILIVVGFTVWWNYKEKVIEQNNFTAREDLKFAYSTSQVYFVEFPNGRVTLPKLKSYGFVQSSGVTLTVNSGGQYNLQITSAHSSGTKTYTVNSGGEISSK